MRSLVLLLLSFSVLPAGARASDLYVEYSRIIRPEAPPDSPIEYSCRKLWVSGETGARRIDCEKDPITKKPGSRLIIGDDVYIFTGGGPRGAFHYKQAGGQKLLIAPNSPAPLNELEFGKELEFFESHANGRGFITRDGIRYGQYRVGKIPYGAVLEFDENTRIPRSLRVDAPGNVKKIDILKYSRSPQRAQWFTRPKHVKEFADEAALVKTLNYDPRREALAASDDRHLVETRGPRSTPEPMPKTLIAPGDPERNPYEIPNSLVSRPTKTFQVKWSDDEHSRRMIDRQLIVGDTVEFLDTDGTIGLRWTATEMGLVSVALLAKNINNAYYPSLAAAKAGDVRAQYALGYIGRQGVGDPVNAWKSLMAAHKNGHAFATREIGLSYQKGEQEGFAPGTMQGDFDKGLLYLRAAARRGAADVIDWNFYGDRLDKGLEMSSENYDLALLQDAAEQGNYESETTLGRVYLYGLGVKAEPVRARQYFRSAAEHGSPIAQVHLSLMKMRGQAASANPKRALEELELAAEQGNPYAHAVLMGIYRKGSAGIPKSPEKSESHLQAISGLQPPFLRHVGEMLSNPRHFALDWETSAVTYEFTGEHGHAADQLEAYQWLIDLLRVNRVPRKDRQRAGAMAQRMILLAAQRGVTSAELTAGTRFMGEVGVPMDPRKADFWLRKAADKGDARAAQLLARLRKTLESSARAVGLYLDKTEADDTVERELFALNCTKSFGVDVDAKSSWTKSDVAVGKCRSRAQHALDELADMNH